jgi:hypothetical protein
MFLKEKFINYFSINNSYYGSIKINDLIGLNIEIPNIQRITDDSKINDIVNYQCDYHKKNNRFNIIGVINLHYCLENKTLYLTDGQHRFQAIKKMYVVMGHNIDIPIECIIINTYNDLKNNFKIINKNTPLPEFPDKIDKNIPETASIYFKNKYNLWSKNSRARRPHLYFNFFQETLGFLTDKLNIDSPEKLIQIIEDYNTKLSQWSIEQFPDKKNLNQNIIQKCKDSGFYLGLYKHVSDNYGYKWCQEIIKLESGIIIKDTKKSGKKKIPKSVKNNSWDTYIGKDIGQALCICCNMNVIDSKFFIGGHIISEKNGGIINVDNIIPICSECNSSMGYTNMNDFIKKYYPSNYDNFKKKKYLTEKKENKWNLNLFG